MNLAPVLWSDPEKPRPEITPTLVKNLLAPEVFADGAPFFAVKNGVLTITLASTRLDNSTQPATPRVVVIGRVTLPVAGARELASGLHDFLERHGVHAVSPGEKARMQ